ncbi:glycosyltransferase [Paragemmobacter kunshanensis]|uniref:glycosyltransferase n=1 Tax=Paragemmobacter kunshanensis TaxID=2583234 RepID=UPI0033130665
MAGELKEDCWGPVDILVPVRNEADRLLSDFLTDLVRLNHPRGKIFIVDDRSTDESAEIIARVC